MTTKAELTREIEGIEKRIEKNAKDLYDKSGIQKLKDELDVAKQKYYREVDEINEPLNSEIINLQRERFAIENSKKLVVPSSIIKFFESVWSGTTWNGLWEVKWFSEDERFVYASLKGHSTWTGRGQSGYYPTQHRMWDRLAFKSAESCRYKIADRCLMFEHTGKLPVATLNIWKAKAIESAGIRKSEEVAK